MYYEKYCIMNKLVNPIVQLRGGIAKENFIRPIKPQRPVGLLLAMELGIFCNPFVDNC